MASAKSPYFKGSVKGAKLEGNQINGTKLAEHRHRLLPNIKHTCLQYIYMRGWNSWAFFCMWGKCIHAFASWWSGRGIRDSHTSTGYVSSSSTLRSTDYESAGQWRHSPGLPESQRPCATSASGSLSWWGRVSRCRTWQEPWTAARGYWQRYKILRDSHPLRYRRPSGTLARIIRALLLL